MGFVTARLVYLYECDPVVRVRGGAGVGGRGRPAGLARLFVRGPSTPNMYARSATLQLVHGSMRPPPAGMRLSLCARARTLNP